MAYAMFRSNNTKYIYIPMSLQMILHNIGLFLVCCGVFINITNLSSNVR